MMTEEEFKKHGIEGVRCTIHTLDGMRATGKVTAGRGTYRTVFGVKERIITEIFVEHYGSLRMDTIVKIDRAEGV